MNSLTDTNKDLENLYKNGGGALNEEKDLPLLYDRGQLERIKDRQSGTIFFVKVVFWGNRVH